MRIFFVLAACLLAVSTVVTPVFAQSDTTSTLLQQLQNWNSGNAAAPKMPTTLDTLKTTALAKASLAAIDTDRNGTVSKEELATVTNRLFDVADSDRNGQLSETELTTFAANMNKVLTYLR